MKCSKYILTLPLLLVLCLSSQEYDEEFLDSLPDELKEDVLERADKQGERADKKYSSFKYSSKLDRYETLDELKKRLESSLDEFEARLKSEEEINADKDIQLFGKDFFSTFQTSFMPVNEPNPDSSYALDVGDVLNIQLIGAESFVEEFPINGDGSINFPDIGKIIIAGLTLNEASDLIKARINKAFIGTEAFVTIETLRDVNVLVTGNAENPGIYTLSGNSNMLQALSAAGGINEFGSFREINLVRNNVVVETLDVYDLLIDGNYSIKKRLRSGDVVFVKAIKNIISIVGAVKRPAKYELTDDEYLSEALRFANGLKQTADIQNISLERMLDGSLKSIPIRNNKQFDSISSIDGDLIYVREYAYRQAKISGQVLKPGTYTMANGETLFDLIDKAGGYNENAYIFGAIYLNEYAKSISKEAKDILYEEFLDNIIDISQKNIGGNMDLAPIVKLTSDLRNSEAKGRIVVDLVSENNSPLVSEGDELFIPEINNNVFIFGEVSTEGAVMYESSGTVESFISKSGGYKQFADPDLIYLLHPNGESQRYSRKRNIFENQPKNNLEIYPGTVIFVPRKLDDTAASRIAAQAYVSILGNLGIALASLSSINNNN